jgi:hypothetical protein
VVGVDDIGGTEQHDQVLSEVGERVDVTAEASRQGSKLHELERRGSGRPLWRKHRDTS